MIIRNLKKRLIFILVLGFLLSHAQPIQAQKSVNKNKIELASGSDKRFPAWVYDKVITPDVKTGHGLFNIHQSGEKLYFEIPALVLDKEILIVSRIARKSVKSISSPVGFPIRSNFVIKLQKRDNSILMRSVSYNTVTSEQLNINKALLNHNLEPIVHRFKIESVNSDLTSFLIDVTDFFTSDVPMISGVNSIDRRNLGISTVKKDLSMITSAKAYPGNVEVKHLLTFRASKLDEYKNPAKFISVEMHQSFMILPEEPMLPRLYDERVNGSDMYHIQQIDYGSEDQKVVKRKYIHRWRLEPSDWNSFGENKLIEPIKPIVYYLDPTIPNKWIPYIKQGVIDWQKAFERIGFKNAILVRNAPSNKEDPDWNADDIRYSTIRYLASTAEAANAPYVHDPRTGEILKCDIIWTHNIMKKLKNWFFVQTAAANPKARNLKLKDSIMGRLIQFVISHEVGHSLGLDHNMVASTAYSVDSLRSRTFTSNHGTAPSIMDYARFNYIAQPEDSIINFYPRIGEYDMWAIEYNYKPIPNVSIPDDEKGILNKWVKDKSCNQLYQFRRAGFSANALPEDLGNDHVEASELGVKNLKIIMQNLIEWSIEDETKHNLKERYEEIINQFSIYIGHVIANIGGKYENHITLEQPVVLYNHVPSELQRRATKFLNHYVLKTPSWLINNHVLERVNGRNSIDIIKALQEIALNNLLNDEIRIKNLLENEAINGPSEYSFAELLADLNQSIFSELSENRPIDIYRRNLQKSMVEKMNKLVNFDNNISRNTDVPSLARANLVLLKNEIEQEYEKQSDQISRFHLIDLATRIDKILKINKYSYVPGK